MDWSLFDDQVFIKLINEVKDREFIEGLKNLKESNPSKEFLENFKEKLNKCEYNFFDYFYNESDIVDLTIEIIDLFLYFGYDLKNIFIIDHFDDLGKELVDRNYYVTKENYKKYPGFLSFFEAYKSTKYPDYNNSVKKMYFIIDNIKNPGEWLMYFKDNYYELEKLITNWKTNLPSKEVLDDFKTVLNCKKVLLNNIVKDYILGNVINADFFGDMFRKDNQWMFFEDYIKLIDGFIFFGVEIDEEDFKNIYEIEDRKKEIIDKFTKVVAGRKIANYITTQMDDEFHLSELRKRIELRKFKDLMKEKEK